MQFAIMTNIRMQFAIMTNIRMYWLNKAKVFPLLNPKGPNHCFKTGTNKQLKQGNR